MRKSKKADQVVGGISVMFVVGVGLGSYLNVFGWYQMHPLFVSNAEPIVFWREDTYECKINEKGS